jgi:hypothetical protein
LLRTFSGDEEAEPGDFPLPVFSQAVSATQIVSGLDEILVPLLLTLPDRVVIRADCRLGDKACDARKEWKESENIHESVTT